MFQSFTLEELDPWFRGQSVKILWVFSPNGFAIDNIAYRVLSADANVDGRVDITDFGILKDNLGRGDTWQQGDFDSNGRVDLADFGMKKNFGKTGRTSVPEPSGAVVALMAALGLAAVAIGISQRLAAPIRLGARDVRSDLPDIRAQRE